MPVHRTKGGGYQWGSHGKIYYGKGARDKATKQGQAAYASGYKKDEVLETKEDTEKMERCVKKVKGQSDVDNPYAVCSASTDLKKKSGGPGFTKKSKLKETIKQIIKEVLQEEQKFGYVVAGVDQSKQSYRPGDEDNVHVLRIFSFNKYPEHKALETAIQYAQQNEANVYTMRNDGTYGEKVWPEEKLTEEKEDMVKILKGKDYSTINGLSYHLKECGCDTTMGYDKGDHVLMVRRDLLPLAVDSLKNTCDNLGQIIAEKLEQKHFKK